MDTQLNPAEHATHGEVVIAEPATPPRRGRTRRGEHEGKSARRVSILAHSLYRDMRAQGFVTGEIVSVASALLGELISDFKGAQELRRGAQVASGRGADEHEHFRGEDAKAIV